MEKNKNSVKKMIWVNIIFFSVTTLGAVIGAPLYIYYRGIAVPEIALFAFYMAATGLSITVGYHRLFSHATFRTNPVIQFLLLFFGAAAFEETAYTWSSQHRDHHRYVDTDQDPYSIKKGFLYAHIGWLLFWEHKIDYQNVKDLEKNQMLMHQHNYYLLWSVGAGIVLPVLIGAMTGNALGALVFSVCCRITIVYHSTFFINSICHMFGKSTYDVYATAKDHWLIAFLTYGEGYHNYHHRFPSDYRNGVRWYQWDPSKWIIAVMEKIGLASKLCRVSNFSILSAKLAAENRIFCDRLVTTCDRSQMLQGLEAMKQKYGVIRRYLTRWEFAAKEYKELLQNKMSYRSREIKAAGHKRLQAAQSQFMQAQRSWREVIDRESIEVQSV